MIYVTKVIPRDIENIFLDFESFFFSQSKTQKPSVMITA